MAVPRQTDAAAVTIEEIALADEPGAWSALGFAVVDDVLAFADVRIRLLGREAGRGIVGWTLSGIAGPELDGLPTTVSAARSRQAAERSAPTRPDHVVADDRAPAPTRPSEVVAVDRVPASVHPNGVVAVDHVVAFSPRLDRTVEALSGAGLDLRRVREEPTPAGAPRQAFFRLVGAILEVVQIPDEQLVRAGGVDAPARFWGLALLSEDIERTAAAFGEHVGEIRPAVQPGRRIATVRRSAGLAVPVALMSAPA